MIVLRRTSSTVIGLGLLVLAVVLGSLGLGSPAVAAEAAAPANPLQGTLVAAAPTITTGGTSRFTGTSPALGSVVPGVPSLADVRIEAKVAGASAFAPLATVEPESDGSFAYAVAQARTTEYRAVPLDPLGVALEPLVASETVTVTSRGTVSLAAKRVAKRTYVVSGKAAPVVADQVVTVQVKKGASYGTVGRARTDAQGVYTLRAKLPQGKRTLRVVSADTASATGATTTRVVRIR